MKMPKQLILALSVLFCAGCSSALENRVGEPENRYNDLENRVSELESQLIWVKYLASSAKGSADFDSDRAYERIRNLKEKVWALEMREMGFPTLPELAEKALKRLKNPELYKD